MDLERVVVLDSVAPNSTAVIDYEFTRETDVDDIHTAYFAGSLYTNPVHLDANSISGLITGWRVGSAPAMFCRENDHLLCLSRLERMTAADINAHTEAMFRETDVKFILFEDVILGEAAHQTIARPHQVRRYHANWRRVIDADCAPLSSKQAANLRRKARKLQAYLDVEELDVRFNPCTAEDVEKIAALNKDKIERSGQKHQLDDRKLEIVSKVCTGLGHTASIYHGDELIAGTVVCVVGERSYFMLLGHDLRYEKFSAGAQATFHAFQELQKQGVTEANFLWGDSRWKSDFRATREVLSTVIVARDGWAVFNGDFVSVSLRYAIRAAKAAIKPHVSGMLTKARALRSRSGT